MTHTFAKAAAAAIAFSFAVATALPVLAQENSNPNDTGQNAGAPVFFDLGIDVSQLPQDTAGATKYFAAQAPETQRVLLAACHTYLAHPTDAAMPQTLIFCKAINAK